MKLPSLPFPAGSARAGLALVALAAAALLSCQQVETLGKARQGGDFCFDDSDCATGLLCIDKICTELNTDGGNRCTEGSCPPGQVCVSGTCQQRNVGTDADGDTFTPPEDCNDDDPYLNPAAIELCDGSDNDCDGMTDEACPECEDGETRTCGMDIGACSPGEQRCVSGRWSPCTGGQPETEVCDAQDNDCDGSVDEGCPCSEGTTQPCGVDRGSCTTDIQTCVGGLWRECGGVTPSQELCDAEDNDCDGLTDEGYALNAECVSLGECGAGVRRCRAPSEYPPAPEPPAEGGEAPPAPEVPGWICSTDPIRQPAEALQERCDNKDNDCDGMTDEDFGLGAECDGQGACGSGLIECRCRPWEQAPPAEGEEPPPPVECDLEAPPTICSTEPGGSADESRPERCDTSDARDGVDDDCDGEVDEDFEIGRPCQGVGACGVGRWECRDLETRICSSDLGGSRDASQPEICDHLDNDCDGRTDEGFISDEDPCFDTTEDGVDDCVARACQGLGECGVGQLECLDQRTVICSTSAGGSQAQSGQELCDGLDNDCDGLTDEDFRIGQSCTGEGECPDGVFECDTPRRAICSSNPGGSEYVYEPELCDTEDNDCDGDTDEDFLVGQDCLGTGSCGPGVYECFGLLRSDCSSNPGGGADNSRREICDGLDNDCDGAIDEDYLVGQPCVALGECGPGLWECRNQGEARCSSEPDGSDSQSVPEVCNLKDDDCDGQTDEEAPAAMCPPLANATVKCVEGVCRVDQCDEHHFDLVGVPGPTDDGCECHDENEPELGNETCGRAIDLGGLYDGSARFRLADGRLVAAGSAQDVDWYSFRAVDNLQDDLDAQCDRFYARVRFLENPFDNFQFEVYAGDCGDGNVVGNGCTDYTRSLNYHSSSPANPNWRAQYEPTHHDPAPSLTLKGECPCRAPFVNVPAGSTSQIERKAHCSDNTTEFHIKVTRRPGVPQSCAGYRLEVSNGLYQGGPNP